MADRPSALTDSEWRSHYYHPAVAKSADLRSLRAAARDRGGPVWLGRLGNSTAWSPPEHAVLVLGPPRSGKTSALALPNLLLAPGAVVAASTKPELMRQSAPERLHTGPCWLFDPTGSVSAPPGVEPVAWSPLDAAGSWDDALHVARILVQTARPGTLGPEESHFVERAGTLLAPLLWATSLSGRDMVELCRLVDTREVRPALAELARADDTFAADQAASRLEGVRATEDREQSAIWSTLASVLSPYSTTAALASSGAGPGQHRTRLDTEAFVRSEGTIYLCAESRLQRVVAPVLVGLVDQVRTAAYRRSAEEPGGPPVLAVLDEVANIAPIPELPSIVSEGGGQGLLVLACLQDLSQARARWGAAAEGFLTLFGTTVVLPGVADVATLEAISTLVGQRDAPSPAHSVTRRSLLGPPERTQSVGTRRMPRLEPSALAHGRNGRALVLDARQGHAWVELTPAFAVEPFRSSLAEGLTTGRSPERAAGRPDLATLPPPSARTRRLPHRPRGPDGGLGRV